VQVMSHARENQLREPGWKIGVSDLSLPVAIQKMNLKDPFLFQFSWIELIDPRDNLYAHDIAVVGESDLEFAPRTETEFMNMASDRYHWMLMNHSV